MAKTALKLLAPYIGVIIFWCVLSNAWLAILAYHLQALLWSRGSLSQFRKPDRARLMLLALPTAIAGLLLYVLVPYITHTELTAWLEEYRLTGISLAVMIPYFGILHPLIEQIHWCRLREQTHFAHLAFAGYHMLVLYSLLTIPWLIVCFVLLASASFIWQQMQKRSGTLLLPTLSHILADLGIVIVAFHIAA